ncbi:hypothetical protein ACSX1A_10695 [Pontibacter sp. MBLB2868]|uniref:hypothetical protein n=1 Tax=Pontibacter sp. MBLB2868 TaxID=3451555 RepID=UPI003F751E1C
MKTRTDIFLKLVETASKEEVRYMYTHLERVMEERKAFIKRKAGVSIVVCDPMSIEVQGDRSTINDD